MFLFSYPLNIGHFILSTSIRPWLLQISWRVFSRVGSSAPRPTPDYPGGPMFSVRVVSLSWLIPILKHQELIFCRCITLNVAQEPWRAHACNGLGRNKWHYSSLVSIQLSARCIPSKPSTGPSIPQYYYLLYQIGIFLQLLLPSVSVQPLI
jgi:hypothetical protein